MKHSHPQLSALRDLAIEAIRTLVSDPKTPASVRLNAAKMIVESVNELDGEPDAEAAGLEAEALDLEAEDGPEADTVPAARHTAKTLAFKAPPKIGRNDYCPCHSGLKYKKCCLLKMQRPALPRGPRPLPLVPADPPPAGAA